VTALPFVGRGLARPPGSLLLLLRSLSRSLLLLGLLWGLLRLLSRLLRLLWSLVLSPRLSLLLLSLPVPTLAALSVRRLARTLVATRCVLGRSVRRVRPAVRTLRRVGRQRCPAVLTVHRGNGVDPRP